MIMPTMTYVDIDLAPSPGSPPGMTSSKTSKSSSFRSTDSEDGSVFVDVAHFEDIGLEPVIYAAPPIEQPKVASISSTRDLARPHLSMLKGQPSLAPKTDQKPRNVPVTVSAKGHRSVSPNPFVPGKQKPWRRSWQPVNDRKRSYDLERECDEDDSDDIPDGLILDNVPISPRPLHERPETASGAASSPVGSLGLSPGSSRGPSREKPRVTAGNGTPSVPSTENSGSLRTSTWKSDTAVPVAKSLPPSPFKVGTKSWNLALSELSMEVKSLTVKLEEHAEERLKRNPNGRRSLDSPPTQFRPVSDADPFRKQLLLQQNNMIIDPLPVSKEKQAVLSRTRPSWLPPKDPAEERKHLREYEKMMAHSREMEKRREADRKARLAARDEMANSRAHIWEREMLPRWGAAIQERWTRDLWWQGVVPRCRGQVWTRAIGNNLGLTDTSFKAALKRSLEMDARVKAGNGTADDLRWAECSSAIRRDVQERTWPDLKIFQLGGPLNQSLTDILCAYAMYRSDVGYVSGCHTIAALLLLNLDTPSDAFIALANILNRPLALSFYTSDRGAKASAYNLVLRRVASKSPSLHSHLMELCPDPDVYLRDVFTGLFTSHLSLDEAARLWDVYVFEGDSVLLSAGVGILMFREMDLLAAGNLEEMMKVLDRRCKAVGASGKNANSEGDDEEKWINTIKEVGKV